MCDEKFQSTMRLFPFTRFGGDIDRIVGLRVSLLLMQLYARSVGAM